MGLQSIERRLHWCNYEMVKFKPSSCFKVVGMKLPGVLSDFFQGRIDEVGETGTATDWQTAGAVVSALTQHLQNCLNYSGM